MAMSSQPQSSQSGELTSDDLQEVFEALYSIASGNIINFGLKLKVSRNVIQSFELKCADIYDVLREILHTRLNQLPLLTWHDIVQILQSPTVQQHDLARTIESQYITASQSPASVSQQASAESSHAAIHTQPSTHAPPQPLLHTVAAASVPVTHTLPQPPIYSMDQSPQPSFTNQPSINPPHPAYNFHLPFYQQKYFQPQVLPQYSVPASTVSHSVSASSQLICSPSSGVVASGVTTSHTGVEYNLQPVEPNTQSSRGQTSNSQTQVQEPQSLSISTGDNSASVEDGNDCGPPQPKSVRIKTPMAQFISYITAIYERSAIEKQLNVVKWPPTPSKVFINLACIDRKTVVTKQEADEYTKAMVQDGNVDIILKKKRPIDFDDIAKDLPATALEKVILVEGAPGVGKSTFAWEFCRRWERGEIAQQYQLVLLLRLRDERMSTAKCLNDLIYHPRKYLCEMVVQELEASLGVNTLIVLEGFDELPDACRCNDSLFSQLIYGKLLPFATILVTSRPWATSDLLTKWEHRISQHIEILGFTESQIEEYVRSVFVGTETQEGGASDSRPGKDADEVMAYIGTYPQIKASMYIPLNSTIVVSMYQESKAGRCILPKTLTELYYALTQTLLVRYLYGHPEYGQRKWRIHSLKDDLPEDVYRSLLAISELAYKGICTEGSTSVQLIFSELPSNIQTLGLMQSVPQLYIIEGPVMSHNFLQLTVQEFLAALHISFMSPEQQLEHFQRHKDGRLRVVLRFLAGLTKLDNIALKNMLGKPDKKNHYEPQNEYCTYLTPDVAVSTYQVNWMFEAQKSSVVTSTLESKCVEFVFDEHMLPLEFYSLGYCIAHSQCKWVLVLNEEIGKDEVDMLSSGFLKEEKTGNFTAALRFRDIPNTCMDFVYSQWNIFLFTPELYVTVTHKRKFYLSSFSNLEVLHLQLDSRRNITIEGFSHLEYLQSLTISSINGNSSLSHKSCLCLKELLLSSKYLKCLHLNDEPYHWNMRPQDMESLTKAMTENQSLPLNSLVLGCHCNFTESAARDLAKFVLHSSTLKGLYLSHNNISDAGATALAQALHHNSSLKELELSNNNISDAGATALAQALHHNSILEGLDLFDSDEIGEEGTRQLLQALTVNTSILRLSLPQRCEEYATQCMEYSAVRERISFSTSYTLDISGEQLNLAQLDILTPVAHNCILFGCQINVEDHVLSGIEREHISWSERLRKVLQYRLKQLPPLTWQDIVQALRSPSVQQHDLAKTIESQYITASQSQAPHISEEIDDVEYKRRLDEALLEGYAKLGMEVLLLIGAGGSGKTHFKYLALGLDPPEERDSTGLLEDPIKTMSLVRGALEKTENIEDVEWTEVSSERFLEMIAHEIIKKRLSKKNITSFEHEDNVKANRAKEMHDKQSDKSVSKNDTPSDYNASLTKDRSIHIDSQALTDTSVQKADDKKEKHFIQSEVAHVSRLYQDILNALKSGPSAKALLDVDWIYIVDSGGQPQFREMLPVLVKSATACVLTVKLNEPLDKRNEVEFVEKGKELCKPYQSQSNNQQVVKRCSQIVASQTKGCKLFLVGTHRDEEDKCKEESRIEKNEKLIKLLEPQFGTNLQYMANGQAIFPLDCKTKPTQQQDEDVMKDLRIAVTGIIRSKPKKEIPIYWLLLELLIHQLAGAKYGVLSYEVCKEKAKDVLKIEEVAFPAAVKFLSETVGTILHFPVVAPHIIFMPQAILTPLSELVKLHHILKDKIPGKCKPRSGEWMEFQKCGILSESLLQTAPFEVKVFSNTYTVHNFITILKELHIVAQIEEGIFFLPSVLIELSCEEIAEHIYIEESCRCLEPLVLYYSESHCGGTIQNWLPVSSFIRLVALLQNNHGWNLYKNELRKPTCLYRNCIQFRLPDNQPGIVTLVDQLKHLEIYLNVSELEVHSVCSYVHNIVKSGLKEVHKCENYSKDDITAALLCPKHKPQCHLASVRLERGQWKWTCKRDPSSSGELTAKQQPWFEGSEKGLNMLYLSL